MSTSTIEQGIPVGTYRVDPVHSTVGFSVTHAGSTTFRSGFSGYEARLTGGEQPRLEGTVEVASIEIPEEQFKGHLLSPDFFDAERHPTLKFESSELAVAEDGSVRLRGELEIRGRSRGQGERRFGAGGEYLDGSTRVGLTRSTSIAATTASTGMPSCRAVAWPSSSTSRSRSSFEFVKEAE